MTPSGSTATPTPWPTRDQVTATLGTMQDRDDLHPNWVDRAATPRPTCPPTATGAGSGQARRPGTAPPGIASLVRA